MREERNIEMHRPVMQTVQRLAEAQEIHKRRSERRNTEMTLAEMIDSTKDVLTAADIAPVLRTDANTIRAQAREDPEKLGFPIYCAGQQVRIPRRSFLKFMGVDIWA